MMELSAVTTILLVRHGHVPGIEPERFRGRTDIELTERGVVIAEQCQASVEILPSLNDIDYGEWLWRTHDEMRCGLRSKGTPQKRSSWWATIA